MIKIFIVFLLITLSTPAFAGKIYRQGSSPTLPAGIVVTQVCLSGYKFIIVKFYNDGVSVVQLMELDKINKRGHSGRGSKPVPCGNSK